MTTGSLGNASRDLSDCVEQLPVVIELPTNVCARTVFQRLRYQSHCIFLESSLRHKTLGRFSYVTCDPFDLVRDTAGSQGKTSAGNYAADFVQQLNRHNRLNWQSTERKDLPPFQGGLAGVLTYEVGHAFEQLPQPAIDEFQIGSGCLAAYDVVVAFDHETNRAWIVSQGFPETDIDRRRDKATERAEQFQAWILGESPHCEAEEGKRLPLPDPIELRSPMRPSASHPSVYSNFSRSEYLDAVGRVIEYIHAGDIFQANLAQRLVTQATSHAAELYLRLRAAAPATFAGYFDAGEWQVASCSPERLVEVRSGAVESRPIKGTRQQTQQPIADLYAAADLHASDKDNAENVMIVDLIRNDLSRVCQPDSIHVSQLCGLETYGYVQHLVSAVKGELNDGVSIVDLLAATFPGGSITGAPKIRAMEIIAELEGVARGPYCGSMGYINWNGDADLNILIRTITAAGGWWQMPVGGGIVADSVPLAEYEETWHKAAGLLAAVRQSPGGEAAKSESPEDAG